MHVDSQYTGDKEWNFIGPNVILQNDELDRARVYQYEYGVASAVEDNTRHATAPAEEVDRFISLSCSLTLLAV